MCRYIVVNHKDGRLPPRLHLSSGENGTSAVAVVGIGGYKNEVGLYKSNAGPPPYLESNLVSTLETDM